jgi:hypothetical protein
MRRYQILITGYRGTGKDSLFKLFQNNAQIMDFEEEKNIAEFSDGSCWFVFAEDTKFDFLLGSKKIQPKRIGFADILKIETHRDLHLPDPTNLAAYDIYKERMLIDGKNLRQHYIDFGQEKRSIDKDHWCRSAFEQYPDSDICITDWRFKNEFDYGLKDGVKNNCVTQTIRVFRSNVPIPKKLADPTIDSEHNLDEIKTDFVLLSNKNDFDKLVLIMPQYKNYVLKCVYGVN